MSSEATKIKELQLPKETGREHDAGKASQRAAPKTLESARKGRSPEASGSKKVRHRKAAKKSKRRRADDDGKELFKVLSTLDERLMKVLGRADVRLLRAAWLLNQPDDFRIPRRQDLEGVQWINCTPSPLLGAEEAVALIQRGDRCVASLSYGKRGSKNSLTGL